MGIRKPGLWHGPRRVEIEAVNARMNKECERCGDYPEVRRLVIEEGVGRSAKKTINCMVCGRGWLRERLREAKRALRYLRTGKGSVRSG
jgi:hypothetical protein